MLLATKEGLIRIHFEQDLWKITDHYLDHTLITCVCHYQGVLLAGTPNGLYRSTDDGATWENNAPGLEIPHIRWLAVNPDQSGQWFAGTEPAAIFISLDHGATWQACSDVSRLRDQHRWSLPYSPEAGCVRDFAFGGEQIYAAVEVGGVLVSKDSGNTWQLAKGSDGKPSFASPPPGLVHPDVHSLETNPQKDDYVYAATGGGLYHSTDKGDTWAFLYNCYIRALWLDPKDPKHLIAGPGDGVGRDGRIEESRDGGHTWRSISDDLNSPWPNTMPERFVQIEDRLFCILDDGRLLTANIKQLIWQEILSDTAGINCIAA